MNKPIYMVRSPSPVSADTADRLRSDVRKVLGDPDAVVLVLGDGMSFEVIHTKPQAED